MASDIKRDLPKKVQEVGELKLHGPLVDDGWLQHIRFDSGKPHLVAIFILAEIVYWYKPTVIADEATGQVKEIKKKFRADKLQKTYQALGDRFGVTKRMAQDACIFLRDRKLITIEQRTVYLENAKNLGNVTFIEPVLENIRKISCMCKEYNDPITLKRDSPPKGIIPPITLERDSPIPLKRDTPITLERDTLHRIPITENTNTKITSNTVGITSLVTKNALPDNFISPSVSPSEVNEGTDRLTDGLSEILEILHDEHLKHQNIHPEFLRSIEGIINHMYFSTTIEIDGAVIPQKIIRKTLGQLTVFCIEHTYKKFDEYTRLHEVRNPKKYLQSVLYNSIHDESISMKATVNYNVFGNGMKKSGTRN